MPPTITITPPSHFSPPAVESFSKSSVSPIAQEKGYSADEFVESSNICESAAHEKSHYIEDGAMIAFLTVCSASIIGIPFVIYAKYQADKEAQKPNHLPDKGFGTIVIALTLPGILAGLAAMPIGAGIGGIIKLCKKIGHRR